VGRNLRQQVDKQYASLKEILAGEKNYHLTGQRPMIEGDLEEKEGLQSVGGERVPGEAAGLRGGYRGV